jgi:uncharacterized protein (DUF1499 family)
LQVPRYIAWSAEEAGHPDGLHWAVLAWWWDAVTFTPRRREDTAYMLLQSPDAVAVGNLLAWWRRPCNLVFVSTATGSTAEVAMAGVQHGRRIPCPIDPQCLQDMENCIRIGEPLWVPQDYRVRRWEADLVIARRRAEAPRAALSAAAEDVAEAPFPVGDIVGSSRSEDAGASGAEDTGE